MNHPDPNKSEELIDRAIRDASAIGRTWAAHGLTAGKSALETSALTLRKVASFLGDLSETIGKAKAEATDADTGNEAAPSTSSTDDASSGTN